MKANKKPEDLTEDEIKQIERLQSIKRKTNND